MRTSLPSSCWNTEGLFHWFLIPEPEWRSYNRLSPRAALCPLWGERAWGSEWTQRRGERRGSPALPQPLALPLASPLRFHFGACSRHRLVVTGGALGRKAWVIHQRNAMTAERSPGAAGASCCPAPRPGMDPHKLHCIYKKALKPICFNYTTTMFLSLNWYTRLFFLKKNYAVNRSRLSLQRNPDISNNLNVIEIESSL